MPTYVFQVRFPPRKHGVRGNECQKRSVVSVWYAQNSLPFCTEVWYTTLTGCEDPTKMLMRVCILLLMQTAPLTGTATSNMIPKIPACSRCRPHPSRGQQLTVTDDRGRLMEMQTAPLTGTATQVSQFLVQLNNDAALTPHGDSNFLGFRTFSISVSMQPAPLTGDSNPVADAAPLLPVAMQPASLTGTATRNVRNSQRPTADAARTPHGDSNSVERMPVTRRVDAARSPHGDSNLILAPIKHFTYSDAARAPHGDSNLVRLSDGSLQVLMQPAPLTGTETRPDSRWAVRVRRCSPRPSRGQQHSGTSFS